MTTMRECFPAGPASDPEAQFAAAQAAHRALCSSVGKLAKRAASWSDVELVATRTRLLRRHRPAVHDVLSVQDTVAGTYVELGFLDDDGAYVGLGDRLVLCEGHDTLDGLTLWPCPEVTALVSAPLTTSETGDPVDAPPRPSATTAA